MHKFKIGTLVASAAAIGVAFPAAAHPQNSNPHAAAHGGNQTHAGAKGHRASSHKCQAHNVAYVESGTIDPATASTLAANSDGTWSGTLVIDVTKGNHHAKADIGKTVTYTLSNAKLRVRLDDGATGFSAGERVKVIAKIAAVAGKCTVAGPAATPVLKTVVVHPAAPSGA
jgi:hypothetical protein